eukprot:14531372-Heterocapsa_arctica.AAC.1
MSSGEGVGPEEDAGPPFPCPFSFLLRVFAAWRWSRVGGRRMAPWSTARTGEFGTIARSARSAPVTVPGGVVMVSSSEESMVMPGFTCSLY